ncbi:BnaAnng05590D [Brassica napus]|uniref:BnaAnng05590D protein n=1 Tax=Brassica napus TaxID=3708 RepID=A0A078HRN6_BRANA|nr:BnaAnng05590D [Brassica napus]
MASEEPSNQQTAMLPPRTKDDPTPAIRDILEIVDNLHKKFVPPSQKEQVLITSRSDVAHLTNPSQVPEKEGLKKTTSLPVPSLTEQDDTERYIPKLRRNLRLLKEDVVKLQDLRCEVADEVGKHITPLEKLLKKVEKVSSNAVLTKGMKKDLEDINKKIFNLMCQVPLLPNKRRKPGGLDSEGGDGENNGKGIECLPAIHVNEEDLKRLAVFRHVRDKFKNLSSNHKKICLLSFAVFPENQEVNRTMLMYWWIGEGILPDEGKPEDVVEAILDEFVKARLIEPVENKRKVDPNSYKMTPFVHSSVVLISKEIKLFDIYRKGEKPTMHKSDLNKVCLVEGSSSQPEAKATKMPDVNLIETVFNVSERFPDFAFKWFSEDQPSAKKKFGPMSKTVFKTAKRHIEVENPELMRHLKHMTKLRLLSFQGISRIERLDDAVCKLRELIILDLRACYNLEKLPEKIDSLKALTYLDITDCYMIDRMPKRLSWLNNLVVLKGFVVSDANDEEKVCTLAELVHLEKLRKLSITINKGDFSVNDLFLAVEEFKSLEKFKVAWGGINEHKKVETTGGVVSKQIQLPKNLKKLDLQCFPDRDLPSWLKPHKLGGLEKLYIKGGTELTGFGKFETEETKECKVKVLRLKFLPRFKVEWRELGELFPKLEFLDKYQSPQVSFCPCDGIGIWRKKTQV